jgi:competence protein ComEA
LARNRCDRAADHRSIAELSRTQIAVYGAIAIALLLVGVRAIGSDRSGDPGSAFGSSTASGSSTAKGSTGGFGVSQEGGGDVVIDVAGAVRNPGVYRLPAGARVTDAVQRAGGGTGSALLDQINLAARLGDGQQVVVPERVNGSAPIAAAGMGGASDQGPISLGSATIDQLDSIDGIGPVTAQDIIDFRDQHGGLSSIEQLDQISGIGPATMGALRKRLQP